MTADIQVAETPLVLFTLRRADDALILGHRLSEWCGRAPTPEEDVALANMGLDLLGQARGLYAYAAETEGAGHDEDDLAYLRDAPQFRNLLLVEQPNGDFAVTIARQFLYVALCRSVVAGHGGIARPDARPPSPPRRRRRPPTTCAIAAEWLIRLGDGTDESHRRAQSALDQLWPYVGEMFEPGEEAILIASGIAADPSALRPGFDAMVAGVLDQATLHRPANTWTQRGGRQGRHSEHLGFLLAEMQHLQRSHPGAKW